MRWDALFADLDAQARSLEQAERAGEIDERARYETGQLRLVERLGPSVGATVRIVCAGGFTAAGSLRRVGVDWLLVDEPSGAEVLVAARGVQVVAGLNHLSSSRPAAGVVTARLGIRAALRGIARDRSAVAVRLRDGASIEGTIERVGSDFVELSPHQAVEGRRPARRPVQLVAVAAIIAVRRRL